MLDSRIPILPTDNIRTRPGFKVRTANQDVSLEGKLLQIMEPDTGCSRLVFLIESILGFSVESGDIELSRKVLSWSAQFC